MIVVDSSVWIDLFRGRDTLQVRHLSRTKPLRDIVVGDLVLTEVLRGARDEAHAGQMERDLRSFRLVALSDCDLAVKAARNYRLLRRQGFTPRKTVDLVIGAFCIENDYALLHNDRDFDPMVAHLGLRLA